MSRTYSPKRSRKQRPQVLQKPHGVIHPRVQQVGPEHFGIVCVDCAKARSKWMLCDFYGNVLVPPTPVAHNRPELQATLQRIRQAVAQHDLRDLLVAIERTGRYHHLIRDAFREAPYEVRIVHPYTTRQFRQPSDPYNKTDDTDLAALHRATVNGFALSEPSWDDSWKTLQLRTRQRRDLVQKASLLCCQIREHLEACLPGYAALFDPFWQSPVALTLARHFAAPPAFVQAGLDGLQQVLRQAGVRHQRRTLLGILDWAQTAAAAEQTAAVHHTIALALDDDRQRKTQEIQALERDLAGRLARTPYVLLLSFPGIHIVTAAELAGEMGPIQFYASGRTITGRAGLYPSRYQSDAVDQANGPLVRRANRRLRAILMLIADNLVTCNQHFRALAATWRAAGKDPRHARVKIAARFCRIAFQIVAGGQLCRHPAMQQRSSVLQKLLAFHADQGTPHEQALADLEAAIAQLPKSHYAAEAQPLQEELARIVQGLKRGPQRIGDIVPIVLARLGLRVVQSEVSGESEPH
jgi:transposase